MKPAFALDFRNDAIALLHRTTGGWHLVGRVPLDEPDLAGALSYLRSTALGLSPRGIATKLILPDDQILYTTVDAPGPDDDSRRAQIRAALEGRTPYDVNDLAFDWQVTGDGVRVAVIARETLAEAEGFANEHRFNPVSFVAGPPAGRFAGEPFFGPSVLAASLLATGETVEPDAGALTIVSRDSAAEAAEEPVELPAEYPLEEPIEEPVEAPLPEDRTQADDSPAGDLSEDLAETAPGPEDIAAAPLERSAPAEVAPEPEITLAPEPVAGLPPAAIADPAPPPRPRWQPPDLEPEEILDTDPEVNPGVTTVHADLTAQAAPLPPDMAAALAGIDLEEAPMAVDVEPEDSLAAAAPAAPAEPEVPRPSVLSPEIEDDLPPVPSWTPAMGFASRRGTGAEAKAEPPLRPAVPRPAAAKPLPGAGAATASARASRAPAPPPRPAAPPKDGGKGLRGLGDLVSAPGLTGGKKRKAMVSPPAPAPVAPTGADPAAAAPPASAASARGLGSGFATRPAPQRGKPRFLFLALVLVLLLGLALIAAWSTTLAFRDADPASIDTAADLPSPDDEMLADLQDPEDLAALQDAEAGDAADLTEPATESATETAEPAPQGLAATELANTAPGGSAGTAQDEIFLATMDAAPQPPDALALPQPSALADSLPAAAAPPPPFGTVYQFDADGLIIATPEGIVTPEGVMVIAGKPPVLPPARPAAPEAAASPVDDSTTAEPALAEQPFVSDPALSGFRPRPRPEGLAPAPADDAALAPAADSRLSSLRPRARPQAIVAAGEAAREAAAAASLAAQAEAAAAATPEANASRMAVAISPKPKARPRDLSRAVEAAVAAAVRQPEPRPEPEPEAKPEAKPKSEPKGRDSEEADEEPEVASAAPRIPSSASVAKQATFKNAINLGKLNLIGIYGTPSKRYAMIRQENGRYKKVKVGDRIDGGRIEAITAKEVRYQKGSRLVTLAMPKG